MCIEHQLKGYVVEKHQRNNKTLMTHTDLRNAYDEKPEKGCLFKLLKSQ